MTHTDPAHWPLFCSAIYRKASNRWVAPGTVLEVDLRGVTISELAPESGLLAMFQSSKVVHLHSLVRTLLKASKDCRISGLVVTFDRVEATTPQLAEIREAVLAFRATGKKTFLHANALNEIGSATEVYWFASAFEEIYMPSIGTVHLAGMKKQPFFLHRLITEKLGAEPYIFARREYKNAGNIFTEEKFTDAHREATEGILNAYFEQITNDIAAARNLSVEKVKDAMIEGPISARRAVELGLITGIAYEDDFYDTILPSKFTAPRPLIGTLLTKILSPAPISGQPKGVSLLYASTFYKRSGGSPYASGKNKIALINIVGNIHMGQSQEELDGTQTSAGADTIVLAIRQAMEDKKIKAIILRVVSPGGSAVASDMIAHQVLAAKKAGKKIIVSMGQYAASGGYYVSCYADKIVAGPLTITGSIGVIAGKMNVRPTWAKLGITFDSVQTSESADIHDPLVGYSPENRDSMNRWIDDMYETFKGHVAAGRKMTPEQVEEIARGRVWVGTKAIQIGLVDVLGNLETAIQVTKAELGLKETDTIALKTFPLAKGMLASLKPARNTRQVARAGSSWVPSLSSTFAMWFLPTSLISTMTTLAQAWTVVSSVALRPELKQLMAHADMSNFPNEVLMAPAFADLSSLAYDA